MMASLGRPLIPEFEPEVIAAGSRRIDRLRTGTTSRGCVRWHRIVVDSRFNKAAEMRVMLDMIEALPPLMRPGIKRIYCDSAVGSSYVIELRVWDLNVAAFIARLCGDIAISKEGGFSSVVARGGTDSFILSEEWD